MKKILALATLVALLSVSILSFGQDNPTLDFRSGKYTYEFNAKEFVANPFYTQDELVNDSYYRIIHFEQTPSTRDKAELKAAGIELQAYLPTQSFYAAIQSNANLNLLLDKGANAILKIENTYKLSPVLMSKEYHDWAVTGDRISLKGVFHKNISSDQVQRKIESLGGTFEMNWGSDVIQFNIPISQLDELYAQPEFYYFEERDAPEVPEGYQDVSNHRSNYLNNPVCIGKSYDGSGVTVMMQDDGPIGPHIDYEGRITTETVINNGDHGDHVAGIIMGAGNLNPDGVGNAPGSHLLVYSAPNSNFNLVPFLYDNEELVITSKSYGDGNNAGYTSLARMLDEQCFEHDALVHVFSAGNSGTSNFGWGAGAGWGNITGGHKQGKNVLAVGNLSDTDDLNGSSSRGPADDGRIKPDICAVGTAVYSTVDPNTYEDKTGTSMACPGVAGSLALLYEAYKDLYGGQNPNAALINAAVLNTADDLGNPGPDFKHGWGRINTRRAYNLLEDGNWIEGSVSNTETVSHTIDVPSGVSQLRVMVYWTDYQGTPSAQKALINDINMTMYDPNSTMYQPWVLNPAPNPGLLDQDAVPGIDDLNNVEQITVDNPMAGAYNIDINGFDIPQGPQRYFVVYEFVQDEIILTYPMGGEHFKPGTIELIRWDAVGETDPFSIEYSTDAGATWNTIVGTLPGDWRSFPWTVSSNLLSGKCRIRVTRGSQVAESKENFSIIGQPNNLNIEWECPNSFNFSWNPVNGAVAYEVYLLGDEYMDSAGYVVGQTNATIYANSLQTQWVSVRAIGADGARGKRAIALEKPPGIGGCTLQDPIAAITVVCDETGPGSCIQFTDLSENAGQGAAWEWSFPGGTPATSNQEQPIICYENEGFYDVTLTVYNGVGNDAITHTQYVEIRKGEALPFAEDFESMSVPANWTLESNGTTFNWGIDGTSSAYNIGSSSIVFNNFIEDSVGVTSSFMTQQIDLSEEGMNYALHFDVAYSHIVGKNDSLFVYATDNCGSSKTLIYRLGGEQLSTAMDDGGQFLPTGDDWRNEVAQLDDLNGKTSVSFIFEAYCETGNAIYVDNINLKLAEDNFDPYELEVFPNPFDDEINIAGLVEGETATIRITDLNGKLVYENTFEVPGGLLTLNTSSYADGMYVIKITSDSKLHKQKLIKGDS